MAMLTRRSLLAALAGIPGVAAVVRLFRWRETPVDAHPSPFHLFVAPPPRVVTVQKRFGPKDEFIHLDVPVRYGDMLLFHKDGWGHRVFLLVLPGGLADSRQTPGMNRIPYVVRQNVSAEHAGRGWERISLQPGDTGIILGNASEESA